MRILVVNPFGIGDVLFSTPLVSNLRAAFPESYIGYVCNIRAQDALLHNPQIDEVFVFEKDEYRKLWKTAKLRCIRKFFGFLNQIRKHRFDLVVDLSLGYHYSLFLMLVGVKKRIGYNYKGRGRFLTDKIDISGYEEKPVAEYYLDLLRFLDIKPKVYNLTMSVTEKDKEWAEEYFENNDLKDGDWIVGVIPAGGASWGKSFSYRHWSWENYARLADRLVSELGAKVVLFGDRSEGEICKKIESAMRHKPLSLCGKTSLKEFAACLAKCDLVVCNDGGPLHVTVSQGVRTVSVFGPVDEKVYGPYPPGENHTVITKDMECRPCYRKFKVPECKFNRRCIKEISVEQLFETIKNDLARVRGER